MALKHFAYIYMSPGFNPEKNTITTQSQHCLFTAVGLDLGKQQEAISVVKRLVAQGVQMIELCGGFGPEWVTTLSHEIKHAVPIGCAYYGPEWREPLLNILKE